MKSIRLFQRLAALGAAAVLAVMLTACYETPTSTVTDTQNDTTDTTAATVSVPEGQMTLSALMGMMASDMRWSALSVYTHTATDASHATFTVADGFGKSCTLNVTYDATADTVSEAMLSYGDTTVSVLCDDTMVIRTIMIAMNEG